jgi:hypothetical protein
MRPKALHEMGFPNTRFTSYHHDLALTLLDALPPFTQ